MEIAFGILGSVASLIGLLIPANGWKQKSMHVIYGLVILILAYATVTYKVKANRISSIELVATKMIESRNMNYTDIGFIQASLAFLEKNKDLYPDTYQRAITMCSQYKCDSPDGDPIKMVTLSSAMAGILTGLASVGGGS